MKALVTGGGGFLGGAIVRMLLARGDTVRSFARGTYPQLEKAGVEVIRGDLSDRAAVGRAVKGVDVVFHVAAKAGIAGPHEEYVQANVAGTRHVLDACREHRVGRLVHTSSPSVVFDGRDMENVDESVPYPHEYHASYPQTKAEAERAVRSANGPALATVCLRPHLIWGPGDTQLVPRLVARARSGMLRKIGSDEKKVDATYVDNAAHAHLLACDRLSPGSPVAGRVFFVANGEPIGIWTLVNRILAAAGEPPVTRSIPPIVAHAAGTFFDVVYRTFGISGEPRMTRFLAGELTTSHWFDLTAARRDLGYEPRVSTEEGLARLAEWFRSGGLTSRGTPGPGGGQGTAGAS